MRFDLPRGRVVPVTSIDVTLDASPHPFELGSLEAIDANWHHERAANPALFDGRMALLSDLSYADGALAGRCHSVRYATLLYWRLNRPPGAEHVFAHAALVSSDGMLVAVRMGRHTANPGKVYFAAGSFEPEDFRGGKVDVDANMIREVGEETGLQIADLPRDPHYHLASSNSASVIFRRYYLSETADRVAERISAHIAAETDPEIEAAVIIRHAADRPRGLSAHMPAIVDWHFGAGIS